MIFVHLSLCRYQHGSPTKVHGYLDTHKNRIQITTLAKAHIKKDLADNMDSDRTVRVKRTKRDEYYVRRAQVMPTHRSGNQGRRNIIVNLHLFKTAGTTLRDTLSRNYGIDHLDLMRDRYWKSSDLIMVLDQYKDAVAISRHRIRFADIRDTGRYRFFPVFFLRKPLEWFTSMYAFHKYKHITEDVDEQPTIIARTSMDIMEFTEIFSKECKNIMNEYINNILLRRQDGSTLNMNEFMSEIGRYQIGTTERYDESCVVIEENLREYFPGIDLAYPQRRNVNPTKLYSDMRSWITDIRNRTENSLLIDKIISMNADTTRMYCMVNKELDMRISGMNGFDRMMRNFKERCKIARHAQLNTS